MKSDKKDINSNGIPVYTRREMLRLMARAGAGTAATLVGLQALNWFTPCAMAAKYSTSQRYPLHKAMFYKKLSGGNVQCELCPRTTIIPSGEGCYCRARRNINGTLYAIGYQRPCIVNFEPIERGPLYHFLPGTNTMTTAAAGCNLVCLYCQNYELAQTSPDDVQTIDLDVKKALLRGKVESLTLTYTEPVCHPEYLINLAKTAKSVRLPVIVCTAAYINPEPLKQLIPYVDAFAVTLKAANDKDYMRLTDAHLEPVLQAIRQIRESGKWLEIITLIVPSFNDERKGIKEIASWINDKLGKDVPWHLSRFTPHYRLKRLPPTPRRTLEEARDEGLNAGLKYVYITNLAPHEGNHTFCPGCGGKIIERLGFKVEKINMKDSTCLYCGTKIPGKWK